MCSSPGTRPGVSAQNNIMRSPSKAFLRQLQREVVERDEYHIKDITGPVDYVIDIGANIGIFALHASNILAIRKKIVCLEPQRDNFECLQENLSGIEKVAMHNIALGNGNPLYLGQDPKNEGMYQCLDKSDGERVDSITLSDLVKKHGIEPNDIVIMKCDCEGGEVFLMDEASKAIMDGFHQICFELHYGSEYFAHCPKKKEYQRWVASFERHIVSYQNWRSDKNGHVVLLEI